ncbi:hypothetical protein AB0C42_01740 [Micromonospora taraxaci]|uniref:hypothetical protein n=1 Tax=Micromonospora taraxaci TaxID=1316803 RepID=UPI0033D1E85E
MDRAWQLFCQQRLPGPLLVAEFSASADPADLLRRPNGRAQLRAALQRRSRPMLDAVVDHRLARLIERHPRLLEDIGGRCAAVRVLVPLLFEATSPDEAIGVARRIVAHTGTGVDTVAIAAIAHLEDALRDLCPPVGAAAEPYPTRLPRSNSSPPRSLLA